MRKVIQELLDSSMSTSAISQTLEFHGLPFLTSEKEKLAWTKWHFSQRKKLYEFATTDKQ